jgi:hypothetical protein
MYLARWVGWYFNRNFGATAHGYSSSRYGSVVTLIEQIESHHPQAARALSEMAQNFEYN